MREIKFRAWCEKALRKMIKPDDIYFDEFNCINDQFCNDDYIFMQYTGLKDKNGKEIYEGDILNCFNVWDEYSVNGKLKWCGYYPAFDVITKNGGHLEEDCHCFTSDQWEFEIIGNIYENPELLKGE